MAAAAPQSPGNLPPVPWGGDGGWYSQSPGLSGPREMASGLLCTEGEVLAWGAAVTPGGQDSWLCVCKGAMPRG